MHYLETLNQKQREAVEATEGPLLILAGAGAGKTKTLTHRMLHLIHKGVTPGKILAITFTNKAAKEMRERVGLLIEQDPSLNLPISFDERPFVSTFHSLGVHIIRSEAQTLGLPRMFSIFDRSDSKRAIKEALEQLGYDTKEFEPNVVLSIISKEKGLGVTHTEYGQQAATSFMSDLIKNVWRLYEERLKKEKALDFDDLLLKTLKLLTENTQARERWQNTWDYVHVDEYQDTNKVQYLIMRALVGDRNNICVVGDVDQNIYSWRGADIKNILNFERDFPKSQMILLEENYRSSKTILDAANAIIKKNKNRFDKNLFTQKGVGEKIAEYEAYDGSDEARFVADEIKKLVDSGTRPEEIAVLYRANFQSRAIEEAFLERNVPYQVLGTKFFDRKEVKDTLSFLRAAMNPDSLSDISRVINVPPRGIGKATIAKIFSGSGETLTGTTAKKWEDFKRMLEVIKTSAETEKPSDVLKKIIEITGLEKAFLESGTEEDVERVGNMKELVTLATKYDALPLLTGIEKLLEDASLHSDQDDLEETQQATRMMTVHSSKGLEFDAVFIVGLEQDLFPHKPMDRDAKRDNEEERRLFYVAVTRARKKLYLCHASVRTIYGSREFTAPSEFLFDVPPDLIHKEERVETGRGRVIYLEL